MTTSDNGTRKEHQRGPVLLRRGQIKGGTTDQRLLDSRGPSEWVHTDPWEFASRTYRRTGGGRRG